MIKVQVILGSTREGRSGKLVADWFLKTLPKEREVNFEFIDLKDWKLPFLEEPISPSVGKPGTPLTEKWRSKIAEADGYIFISPEYNHGYSAVLKNALDHAFYQWHKKPVAFVSYGAFSGGTRAVEQLIQVVVELNMVPLRAQVNIRQVWAAFDEKGDVIEKQNNVKATKLLEDLLWMTKSLKVAREEKVMEKVAV